MYLGLFRPHINGNQTEQATKEELTDLNLKTVMRHLQWASNFGPLETKVSVLTTELWQPLHIICYVQPCRSPSKNCHKLKILQNVYESLSG